MGDDDSNTGSSGYRAKDPTGTLHEDWEWTTTYNEQDPNCYYSPNAARHGSPAVFWYQKYPPLNKQEDTVQETQPEHYKKVDDEAAQTSPAGGSSDQDRSYKEQFKKTDTETKKSGAVPGKRVADPPVQTCGSKQKPPPVVPCRHNLDTVSCSHGRKVSVVQWKSKPTPKGSAQPVLEVVGDPRDDVTLSAAIKAGPCPTHKDHVLTSTPSDIDGSASDTKLTIATTAKFLNPLNSRSFWPIDPPLTRYSLNGVTCEYSDSAEVVVFPDNSWEISLRLASLPGRERQYSATTTITKDKKPETLSVKAVARKKSYDLSTNYQPAFERTKEALNLAQRACEGMEKIAGKLGLTLTFDWPSIGFKGEWGWKEEKNSPYCEFEATIDFGADPLFGVAIEGDILDALCNSVGPFKVFIAQVRSGLERYVTIKVTFELKGVIQGQITTTMAKHSYESSLRTKSQKGKISAEIDAEIQGKIETKILWLVAGAKVGAKTGIVCDLSVGGDSEGPYIGYDLKLKACDLYWGFYAGENTQLTFGGSPDYELWSEEQLVAEKKVHMLVGQ